jgi:hypothetical protein
MWWIIFIFILAVASQFQLKYMFLYVFLFYILPVGCVALYGWYVHIRNNREWDKEHPEDKGKK